jgi:hypothetical protein
MFFPPPKPRPFAGTSPEAPAPRYITEAPVLCRQDVAILERAMGPRQQLEIQRYQKPSCKTTPFTSQSHRWLAGRMHRRGSEAFILMGRFVVQSSRGDGWRVRTPLLLPIGCTHCGHVGTFPTHGSITACLTCSSCSSVQAFQQRVPVESAAALPAVRFGRRAQAPAAPNPASPDDKLDDRWKAG